ncbi:MAG: polyribonucleotide nucleotidyltransferase [Calditrichaeota bacterium]|nr:MAG: polyribonucleotide nucleotidyltransferase [Calditrichota bacterium]
MIFREEIEIDSRLFSIETGKVAKQADGSAWVQFGDTIILATAVGAEEPTEGLDFFPLTVEYREKAYAAGKIPGGFFKREGKPSDNEILNARLVDRSIRPMFPDGYKNEVQIIINVLSADKENDPDVLAITGASAALCLSDIPFNEPIAGVRVGRINNQFVLNPTFEQIEQSDINLVIAGSKDSIIMVEGEALEISEPDMLAALQFGHENIKTLIALQEKLIEKAAKPKREFVKEEFPEELVSKVRELATGRIPEILNISDKKERRRSLKNLIEELTDSLSEQFPESVSQIGQIVHEIEREIVRNRIVNEGKRLDGRGLEDIRPITCEVGVLPRVHGSALFTRGQTQALASTTLGTKMDEQKMEELEGEFWKSYMLHYNFPPFCVGEIRPIRGVSRREIGHGDLAERSLKPVIPSESEFPYTIRIVSDILESNGSSSMATVCAGSLSLMDAGVPIKHHIAGIAMGLIKEDDKFLILTDILGDEDHLGDMDFKVAGSRKGITGFQMDIKVKGIPIEVMQEALEKAKEARMKILDIMDQTIAKPRPEISPYAPKIINFKINIENIGLVIGPGGKTIRDISEKTGATIHIDDDGTVSIAATDAESGKKARKMIEALVQEPVAGQVYLGKVKKITNFGAFVEILPGKEGLLHISEIAPYRINRVEDFLKVGDEIEVKLIKIDHQGKLDLSRKALLKEQRPDKKSEKSFKH